MFDWMRGRISGRLVYNTYVSSRKACLKQVTIIDFVIKHILIEIDIMKNTLSINYFILHTVCFFNSQHFLKYINCLLFFGCSFYKTGIQVVLTSKYINYKQNKIFPTLTPRVKSVVK